MHMKHILKLNKFMVKLQEESWELEEKLLGVRKKRLQLKQAVGSKLLEIQTEDLEGLKDSNMIKTMLKKKKTLDGNRYYYTGST